MEQLFIKAAKLKLRFTTSKGEATVEDLFDFSLETLDTIAKGVNKQLKDSGEESFIGKKSSVNSTLELKLDILKFVIADKIAKEERNKVRAAKQAELAFLKETLAEKKVDAVKGQSAKSIEAKIANLQEELSEQD